MFYLISLSLYLSSSTLPSLPEIQPKYPGIFLTQKYPGIFLAWVGSSGGETISQKKTWHIMIWCMTARP
jgi:hypothetical protein